MAWIAKHWMRIVLAAVGLAMVVIALAMPMTYEDHVEYNAEQDNIPALQAGDVMEQQLVAAGPLKQFSLRAGVVKEAQTLTLKVSLLSGEKTAAETEFPLAKVRTKGRLIYDLPQPLNPGTYTLRVEAVGEGSVQLCGGAEITAVVNGEKMDAGCYVRMTCDFRKYGKSAIFSGVLLMLLSLTPGGGKEKKHA